MYLNILNADMVGFANITAQETLDLLFLTYGNTTAVDLLLNAWDPQQPVDTLFKQIQDYADFSEAGGVLIGHPQQIDESYAKIFATCNFKSACWNEKDTADKMWAYFKVHFTAAHHWHKQIHGESAATSGYDAANAAGGQTEDQMEESTIGALANLETATSTDRRFIATLTEANSRLAKQLEDHSNELKGIKTFLKKERAEMKGQITFNPSPENYCWTHGYNVANIHTSLSCNYPKHGHNREATNA
jgi:hypothetical protein